MCHFRHVNIGSQYQAEVPEMLSDRSQALREEDKETLLWTPSVAEDLSEEEGELFHYGYIDGKIYTHSYWSF